MRPYQSVQVTSWLLCWPLLLLATSHPTLACLCCTMLHRLSHDTVCHTPAPATGSTAFHPGEDEDNSARCQVSGAKSGQKREPGVENRRRLPSLLLPLQALNWCFDRSRSELACLLVKHTYSGFPDRTQAVPNSRSLIRSHIEANRF